MNLYNLILDLLFPRRCPVCHEITGFGMGDICDNCRSSLHYVEEPYCMKCGKPLHAEEKEYCSQCENSKRDFDEGRSVFLYDDVMRKSIYMFKYNDRQEYSKIYAKEIYSHLKGKIKQWNPDALIPIPLHKSKQISRGYNQAYLIAKELSELTKIPVKNKYLIRIKKTKVQKNLDAYGRARNLKNAFKIRQNGVKLKSAILIDDIYTTGATIQEATRVLKDAGVDKVYFIALSTGRD